MAIIKHKRSSVGGRVPTDSDLVLGELAVNTHDGVIFLKTDKNGTVDVKKFEAGASAENVFYVSKSGSDSNDGTTLSSAFLTIDKALERVSVRRGDAGLDSDGAVGSVLETKTRRDLDFYINAATFDITLGTKFNQVFQGRTGSYTKGFTEVLESITQTKDYVNDLSAVNGDATALSRADAYFDELNDIIQNGKNNADALDSSAYPIPTSAYYDSATTANNAEFARDLLLNNKIFISEEVNEFAKAADPDFSYDSEKCKRDIRFAVEALTYDATYLGNAGAYDNANFFFFNGPQIPEDQRLITANSYDRLATVVEQILLGQTVSISGDSASYTQFQSSSASTPDSDKVTELTTSASMIGNTIRFGQSYLTDNFTRTTPNNDSRVDFTQIASGLRDAKSAIDAAKIPIIDDVVAHLDSAFPLLFGIGDRYQDVLDAPEIASTIFVKTGEYEVNNPLTIPKSVSLIGDNLKNTSIRPKNKTSDVFYLNNNAYVSDFTFRDHLQPAAVFAWDPSGDSTTNIIVNSPYIRNCTSITGPDLSRTDSGYYAFPDSAGDLYTPAQGGDGIRNDGNHAGGIRSMVVDSFTQINQGGKGIYLKNRGYCQLVSVFTVYCDVGFLAEDGGFASITNSNSSFGNIGVKATGVSPALYTSNVDGQQNTNDNIIDLKNLGKRPNISDAVKFASDPLYFTVDSASYDSTTGLGSIKLLETPTVDLPDNDAVTFHQRSALSSSGHTFEWIGTGTDVRTAFPYRGGVPVQADEVVQDSDRAGLCFVTSTDQKGDFRVGEDFLIQRSTGTIEGVAFDRSLFARVTPFSLALED
jgi:hypothetical protein